MKFVVGLVVGVVVGIVFADAAVGQWRKFRTRDYPESPHSHNSLAVRQALAPLAARHRQSVAAVFSGGLRVACGAIVAADGWLVTKASELDAKVEVMLPGESARIPARQVGADETNDLALLKVERAGLAPVEFAVAAAPQIGAFFASVTELAVPEAFGVMSVPPHARPMRLELGVRRHEVKGGMRLYEIMPNTGAARAGLRKGDVVIAIDGKPVKTWLEFRDLVAQHAPGTDLVLRFLRAGKEREVRVPLKADPSRHGPKSGHERAKLWGPLSEVRLGFEQVIQHDSRLHPSRCGSLLVDLDGNVVGLNIARAGRFETLALTAEVVVAAVAKMRRK